MSETEITDLRFDLLRLAATTGIPDWAFHHFKPGSKRAVSFLLNQGLLRRNRALDIVPTAKGKRFYERERDLR